jgi:hypothetical protein
MSRPASSSNLHYTRFAAAGRVGSIELLGGFVSSVSDVAPASDETVAREQGRPGNSSKDRWACCGLTALGVELGLALGALRPETLLTVRGNCVTLALPSEARHGASIHQLPVLIAPARS